MSDKNFREFIKDELLYASLFLPVFLLWKLAGIVTRIKYPRIYKDKEDEI